MEESIKDICSRLRGQILDVGITTREMMNHSEFDTAKAPAPSDSPHAEMRANLMLAYRHLEDARMRLGKVLQARDGGVSIYDK